MNTDLAIPIQKHEHGLSTVVERFHAEDSTLRQENAELKRLINKCKERMSGKRFVLKGKVIVSTEEVQRKLMEAEGQQRKRRRRSAKEAQENESQY